MLTFNEASITLWLIFGVVMIFKITSKLDQELKQSFETHRYLTKSMFVYPKPPKRQDSSEFIAQADALAEAIKSFK